jgi:ribosome-associated protein
VTVVKKKSAKTTVRKKATVTTHTTPARKSAVKKSTVSKSAVKKSIVKKTLTKTIEAKASSRISERGEPKRTRVASGKGTAIHQLAMQAAQFGLERKAHNVKVLTLRDLSSVCDYFVILSGDADVHVRAISDHIEDSLAKLGQYPTYREGKREGNWIVLDYIDVVVHVFMDSTRRFYQLEKLWGDAPIEVVTDD